MKKYIITFTAIVIMWELLSAYSLVNPMFLPTPRETFNEGIRLFSEKKIFMDMVYSLFRIMSGLLLAFAVGIPLGILLGSFGGVYAYVEPALDFFRSIPPILVFPLALLVLSTGEESRIAVIVFGCVLIMVLNASKGVMNGNKIRIKVAKIMGAAWHQILLRVVIFDALPQIFIGIRVALSVGIIVGIVTEMLVGTKYGLGSRVVYAQTAYATPELYFSVILVGLLGFLMNKVLSIVERRVIHWKC
jgi:NitT/TauT family transport system permease protein